MAAPAMAPGWGAPMVREAYDYIILDIETSYASDEEVKAWFETTYRAPSNYKDPAKIKAHKAEAFEKCKEKASLLPCSPIIAVGIKSENELRCLHPMWEHAPMQRLGGLVEGFADEQTMLGMLWALFQKKVDGDTVIAGFNIRDFDLPAVRRAWARRKMPIPDTLLNPEQAVFDCMHKYCHLFAGSRDIMVSCTEASLGLGIEPHKVSGAVVPKLYEAKEYEAVVDKVLLDVLEEEQQFVRMTGRAK
jgi:hypothetical protein